ncbi:hypothetical protein STCU_04292 [Strigomonas culicis]|uniref:EF-hand domain-containing protein n=1 Tax=Strigomonas culicis TaxID=28005 RepID=S9UM35_9TRYP|nr:hypothetical protein STCU_04292 [Strigomonas culicis]|eukprot:EPY29988.1 hypothetical protein STCU_04292 [Strigomonas culicis]
MQVAYMARAMGLNPSQDDVVFLVELLEEDGPSTGAVSKARLKAALVDALLTGVLGGQTLAASGLFPQEKLQRNPRCVIRQSESVIYQALKALDTDNKGYVDVEELRAAMTSDGDRFSDKEVEEMVLALADPETGRLFYSDVAETLASE